MMYGNKMKRLPVRGGNKVQAQPSNIKAQATTLPASRPAMLKDKSGPIRAAIQKYRKQA